MKSLILLVNIFVISTKIPQIIATSCLSCNSAENSECSSGNFNANHKDCYGADPCAVAIIAESGHTFRGCSEDPECYNNVPNCETCDGDGCNNVKYPENRLSCVRCSSTSTPDCQHMETDGLQLFSASCVVHQQDGACVTVFNGYLPSQRGCLADLDQGVKDLCAQQSVECVTCSGEHNCNVANVRPDEQCLQCDSQDRGCDDGSHAASGCAAVSDGKCYSKLLEDGSIKRGCFQELPAAEGEACNSDKCVFCTGTGCNIMIFGKRNHGSTFSASSVLILVLPAFMVLTNSQE